jgi:hypothetical protein
MTISKLTTVSAGLAFMFLACDAHTLIGMVPDGSAPDDGAPHRDVLAPDVPVGTEGHTCTPVTFPGDAPYTLPAGVAGTWTGYFQGGSPVPTSDVIKFSIQQLADGSGEVRVTIGTAAPPPPAASATDYYPPGVPTDVTFRIPTLIEGVSYLAHAVTWQGTRLKFLLSEAQPWESWCALQSSYFVADQSRYNCIPGFGGGWSFPPVDAGGEPSCTASDVQGTKQTPVSCPQLSQCNGQFCTCDSCGCAAAAAVASSFDVTFDADLVTGVGDGHNVRLTRNAN